MAPASTSDRYFYSVTSFLLLVLTVIGFHRFYLGGRESDGGAIPPAIVPVVIVHGTALTVWVVLFFIQSLLIASRNRGRHMKLGWVAAAAALVIAVSGPLVAIGGVRASPKGHLFGMGYPQFLLPMLAEITAFTCFVALGLWYRRKAPVHRSMMLLATLSILSGSTSRTPFFRPFFGHLGWMGLFGPVVAIGVVILLARTVLTRRIDWSLAAGGAALAGLYFAAMKLAVGDPWTELAHRIARG
jgi:hypothetical protein